MTHLIKPVLFFIVILAIIIFFSQQGFDFFSDVPKEGGGLLPTFTQAPLQQTYTYSPPTVSTYVQPVQESAIPDYLIPTGFTREQLSPYFEKIKISSAYAYSWGNYPSKITLYSYLSKGEYIDITGWEVRSNLTQFFIPNAIRLYSPYGAQTLENIILSQGNYVNIYSNESVIDRNLRLNKCIGYLENFYDFEPELPRNCPSFDRNSFTYLSGECQSYVLTLWSCKLPDVAFYNSLPGTSQGNECRAFLNTISYGSCYQKYKDDSDFLSNEWRVWIGKNILDPQHDRILLFDKQGLLVDEYVY